MTQEQHKRNVSEDVTARSNRSDEPSILRKLASLVRLPSLEREGWEVHPISSRVFVLLRRLLPGEPEETFLSDGSRFVRYPSFEDALGTLITRRKLMLGESLEGRAEDTDEDGFPVVELKPRGTPGR